MCRYRRGGWRHPLTCINADVRERTRYYIEKNNNTQSQAAVDFGFLIFLLPL